MFIVKIRVDTFDPAAPLVGEVMQVMIDNLKGCEVLRRKLFNMAAATMLGQEQNIPASFLMLN